MQLTCDAQRFLMIALAALALGATCRAEPPLNQLSEPERRTGWQLLFDGRSTDGWRNYRSDTLNDGWAVRDGALQRIAKGAGDIITDRQFDAFELSLEFRIAPGGNSGVMFHVTEQENHPWQTGPEVQILDNKAGKDSQKTGWLYQLYPPAKPGWARKYEEATGIAGPEVVDATRPAPQWNQLYLRVGKTGQIVLNGVHYCHFQQGSDEWNERVAASKFAKFERFGKADKGHICLQDHGDKVAFRNIKLRLIPDGESVDPVDGKLPLTGVPAFPKLRWEGWQPVTDAGLAQRLRPVVLTHAGDGSNRNFVAMQGGMIHVFENDPQVTESRLFLDLRSQVITWSDGFVENEQGLLGLALHPRYEANGEFFVYYTPRDKPDTAVVSRFRVSADDINRADPATEEVLLRVEQPFPNHNGGGLSFGPDGLLYIALGDGGYRNDLLAKAQDLTSWLGSILRIDVDRREEGRAYAIPADNPFRDRPSAKPEIYAYGFRNIWGMSFDRETGAYWAADVGQDLWEEIHLVEKGGNHGWSAREGTHLFGNRAAETADALIDPIWEYDHQVGVSITGGFVYRGSRLPLLAGHYIYADYVSGRMWALKFDHRRQQVVQNMRIPIDGQAVLAFGEDQQGEAYYLVESANGQSIFSFKLLGVESVGGE